MLSMSLLALAAVRARAFSYLSLEGISTPFGQA